MARSTVARSPVPRIPNLAESRVAVGCSSIVSARDLDEAWSVPVQGSSGSAETLPRQQQPIGTKTSASVVTPVAISRIQTLARDA